MDLSVLIVSFNTREKTLACLRSLAREADGLAHEVWVLDNASADGSAAAIRAEFPDVRLLEEHENLGFGRGVNRLASRAAGERYLLLNPDAELKPGTLQELLAFARREPTPGIHGGRTVHADGSPDPDFAWGRASAWSTACIALGLAGLFPRSALFNPEGVGWRLRNGEHEVDIVSGCCFLVHRALWAALGGFDPAFFVYGEEADFCLRARARGVRPRVTTRATVLHHGGASESSLAGKQTKLLAAKRRLMGLHWSHPAAALGAALLRLHVVLRAGTFTALSWADDARFGARAREWNAVWRRRAEWLAAGRQAHTLWSAEARASARGREEPVLR